MPFNEKIGQFWKDPPPAWAFEISEAGISWVRKDTALQPQFRRLDPEVLLISPLHDNVQQADALAAAVREIAPPALVRKARRAAVLLPDYAGRLAVLDFDSFPADPKEQLSLVRFRMKKSVPFDIESAAVSFHPLPAQGANGKRDVVVAIAAHEIIARYEAPFLAAGLQPGFVTFSSLTALNLLPAGLSVLVRLAGRVLTVLAADGAELKLVRCVELPDASAAELEAVLYPTFAYLEDELGARPGTLYLCGFDDMAGERAAQWSNDLRATVEPLRSPFGAPSGVNAGLLGYLAPGGVQ